MKFRGLIGLLWATFYADIFNILKLNPWDQMARNAVRKRAAYFGEFPLEAVFTTQLGRKFHGLSKDKMILSTISRTQLFDMTVGESRRTSLKAEIKKLGLRKTTKETGLDRKTIRAVLSGKKVQVSTFAKVVNGLQSQWQ
jgi:hypothetical protein